MDAKHPAQSKTLWINLIVIAVAILELTNVISLPIPEGLAPWIAFGIGVLNIILRTLTKEPISLSADETKNRGTIERPPLH
jgi:hypothetical protein